MRFAPCILLCGLALGCAHGSELLAARAIPVEPRTTAPTVRATWLGTAGVRIDDGWTALLIDPFVTRPSLGAVVFGRPLEPDTDAILDTIDTHDVAAVLVSHSHYDHLMDAPVIVRATKAELVGSPSTAAIGRAAGLPSDRIRVVQPGEPARYGDFVVTFLASAHAPVVAGRVPFPGDIPDDVRLPIRARDYRMGGAFAIVIEHPAGTLVHHGSASWIDGMYDGIAADVVLLGLAGHRDAATYVQRVVDATGAKRIVPIHWDDFFRPLHEPLRPLRAADVVDFVETVEGTRPDLAIETLPLGAPRVVLGGRDRRANEGQGPETT